ncbi:ABATE domain-containing protein [Streptomyces sp. NPDC052109]|uniref:ABATE domain-containing protein n=1 Tax=Streptomyces sp. NPDC052109 TaxID=3155527 RepID=UPI00341BECB4
MPLPDVCDAGQSSTRSPSGREADVGQATTVREAIRRLVTARRLREEYDGAALTVGTTRHGSRPALPQLTPSGR